VDEGAASRNANDVLMLRAQLKSLGERRVEPDVRAVRSSSRFTTWVPGGMYSPWITTMSSGHDVSENELGASGLPRAHVSPQQP
jgi:hypothetical protein